MYQTELSNNQQTVYVATDLINAGDIVTDTGENANVEKQTVYTAWNLTITLRRVR